MKKMILGSGEVENDKLEAVPYDVEELVKLMEEMDNQPKEELGKRYPGERGMYEIQRMENAKIR